MENLHKLDTDQSVILIKINTTLSSLSIEDEWIKAPEFLPEYEALKGKKIVLVDDVKGIIANNLPEFIVATDGNASAVYHKEQPLEELAKEILSTDPDIVLMDYSLANEINGISVINKIIAGGYTGKIVGYSSERNRDSEFKRAGAIGSINKGAYPVSESVKELINLL
jgi:DNA-binding NarL/FixJ family response regulator